MNTIIKVATIKNSKIPNFIFYPHLYLKLHVRERRQEKAKPKPAESQSITQKVQSSYLLLSPILLWKTVLHKGFFFPEKDKKAFEKKDF